MDNERTINDQDVDELLSDEIETVDQEDERISDGQNDVEGNNELFDLPSGQALTLDETYMITAAEDTKIVFMIGPHNCGKTTIETTIYQMFLNSPVNDIYFAGSKSFQAYEQRAYNTRTKSKRVKAVTPRTSSGIQDIFLHLRLRNVKTGRFTNILVADISGEDFERYRADIDLITKELFFIKSAAYIVSVFDGEYLCDKKKRNGTVESMAQLVRTICDAGLFANRTKYQGIISKFDIVKSKAASDESIYEFISEKKEEMRVKMENLGIEDTAFFDIAAMPDSRNESELDVGFGLEGLIQSWFVEANPSLFFDEIEDKSFTNEFNKLYNKLLG